MHCLFSRSLILGSALLTLLLFSDTSLTQARVIDNINNNNKIVDIPTVKPRPHSPYSTDSPDSPSNGLYQDSFTKRSLYPRIHDDSILAEKAAIKVAFIQQQQQQQQQGVKHTTDNDFEQEQEQQQRHHVLDSALDLDFWGDDEERTLIEPRFPSIDLFEEEDEVFELGDDGILREVDGDGNPRHHNYLFDPEDDDDGEEEEEDGENRYDQIWMVDEWEEELERDIDVLMDWAEEDGILNSRLQAMQIEKEEAEKQRKFLAAKVLGSHGLRDQDSIRNALMDEDEASSFHRVISESWLF
ncbi:hypothetical protein BGX21_001319 [Mortierella sp. AD011]|nr:hypothetical protein BGX20_003501 [Mortierella sp. AD010]KAF9384347.1 hypothetical protein BGX21_001319 [Mortierella sp. AD011]